MSKGYAKYGKHDFKTTNKYSNNTKEIQLLSEYNQKLLNIIKIDAEQLKEQQVLDTQDRKLQPRSNLRNSKAVNELKGQIQDSGLSNVPVAFWSDSEEKFKLLTGHHRTSAMRKLLNSDEFKDGIPIAISSFKDSDLEDAAHYAHKSNVSHEAAHRSTPEDHYVWVSENCPGILNFRKSGQLDDFQRELYQVLDTFDNRKRMASRTKSAVYKLFTNGLESQTFESYVDADTKHSAIDKVLPKLFPNENFPEGYSKTNCYDKGSKLDYPDSNGITKILNGTDTALFQSMAFRISEIGLKGSTSQNDQVIPIFYARTQGKDYKAFLAAREKVLNNYKGINLVTKKAYINKVVFLPQWLSHETEATIYEWNQKEDRFEKTS